MSGPLDDDARAGLYAALQAALTPEGVVVFNGAGRGRSGGHRAPGDRRRVAELPQLLPLPALEALLEGLECSSATVGGWDEGVKVAAAFAAVLGRGGWPQPPACLVDWWAGYPGTQDGWLLDRWASLEEVDQGVQGFFGWMRLLVSQGSLAPALRDQVARAVRQAQCREDFEVRPDDVEPPDTRGEAERRAEMTLEEAHQAALAVAAKRLVYRDQVDEWVDLERMRVMGPREVNASVIGRRATEARYRLDHSRWSGKGRPPVKLPAADILRAVVPVVVDMTYRPGRPQIFAGPHGPVLNRWRPPAQPYAGQVVTDEQVAPYLELMLQVLPDPAARTLWLDWASYIIQFPGEKVEWAPLFFSRQPGSGKDMSMRPVQVAGVGNDNWRVVQLQDLAGTNNAHWAEAQVVLVTELPRGRQRDTVGVLKAQTASSAGQRTVNPKYVTPYQIDDRISWICTTNHHDAVDLTEPDRRFALMPAQEAALPLDLARRVAAFYDEDGSQAGMYLVAAWLRQRVISEAFDAKRCPPMNAAKEAMRRASLDGSPAGVLLERLEEDDAPGSWVRRQVLWEVEVQEAMQAAQAASRWQGRHGQDVLALDIAGFGRHSSVDEKGRLALAGPRVEGRQVQKRVRAWVRRDNAALQAMTPRQVVAALIAEMRADERHGLAEQLQTVLDDYT